MPSRTRASSTWPEKPFAVRRSMSFVLSMRTTSAVRRSWSLMACFSVSLSCCSRPMVTSGGLAGGRSGGTSPGGGGRRTWYPEPEGYARSRPGGPRLPASTEREAAPLGSLGVGEGSCGVNRSPSAGLVGAIDCRRGGAGRRPSRPPPTLEGRPGRRSLSSGKLREGDGPPPSWLEVLPGIDHAVDRAGLVLVLHAHERFHVHDPLPLLAGALGPVVGVGRVGQVLALLELLAHGGEEVVDPDALLAHLDVALERELLAAADDGLDHGARGEVLEVQDLLVAVGVGDLEEAVLLFEAVHLVDGGLDHAGEGGLHVAAVGPELGRVDRQVGGHVLVEDIDGGALVGALDLDVHIEAAGAQDGGVDEVLPVRGPDDDDVLDRLDAVELGEELGDDGGLHVGGDAGAAGADERVHLVEEDDDGHVLGGLLAGLDEDLADLALGLADVLVEQLGALDGEEEALDLLAAFLGDAGGEVVGDGLGDHGLAAAGRAIEQHALRRREVVLLV